MNTHLAWRYDEFKQVGKDYSLPTEVEQYDPSHADFRDIEAESNAVLDRLNVQPQDILIDFGAGTGTFAIQAARRGASVHAVDVSPAMLEHAQAKAAQAGISTITFHHGGFLSYEHAGPPVDVITTSLAFHHLPDFWKGVALARLRTMLKPGGQLYINDVVLSDHHPLEAIATFIDRQTAVGGDFLREDAEGHFRDEFSTYDWVLEGLFSRAGFTVQSKEPYDDVFVRYLCTAN
jgi:putative AdoMet-dependent methyltransferase